MGALAVYLSIKCVLNKQWDGISEISRLENNGYVVNSVPFAIFSASQILKLGMTEMFQEIISTGGDTDTNYSIAGQISGTLPGINDIPKDLQDKVKGLSEYEWVKDIINRTKLL